MARARSIAWLGTIAIVLVQGAAHAQQAPSDAAAAQALFEDGKRLMRDKHYDEACPKLVESQRLDPGGGTLLAIALCHESQGKTATAWGDFNTAASEARKDHRSDREAAAQQHIRALEVRLPRARVVVTAPAAGLEIRRGEEIVGSAQWGTPVPIDPGSYVFEAHAPGKKAWQGSVTIPDQGGTTDVTVPALEDVPVPVAPPPPPPPVAASAPTPTPTPTPPVTSAVPSTATSTPAPQSDSSLRTVGWVTGGVSVAALGVGAIFGASALSTWHDAKSSCSGTRCTASNAPSLESSAANKADVSTVFVTVGGVGLAAALAIIFLAPTESSSSRAGALHVTPMVGRENGLMLGGSL